MTREEAINKWVMPAIKNTWNEKKCEEIIEALEQETVSKESYDVEYFARKDAEFQLYKAEQERCGDTISRADAIKQIQRYGVGCFDPDEFSPETCERFVIDLLSNLPPYRIKSDDKEPTEGHLTLLTECANSGYYCSKCHKKVAEERSNDVKKIKFCSKCGTKIAGEVEKL